MKKFLIVAAIATITVASPVAQAHVQTIASIPSNNSIIDVAPTVITIEFDEQLLKLKGQQPNRIALIDSANRSIKLGKIKNLGKSISVKILGNASIAGKYRIKYRAVAQDGHPVLGVISYTLAKVQ